MVANVSYSFQKDRWFILAFLPLAILCGYHGRLSNPVSFPSTEPIRPLGVACASVRSGLEQRLMLASASRMAATAEAPINLGHLEPKGRINPDGSEVWGYPVGSGLEEVIEVHVKDGRVVREVLRPSSGSSADLVADVLSGEDGEDAARASSSR